MKKTLKEKKESVKETRKKGREKENEREGGEGGGGREGERKGYSFRELSMSRCHSDRSFFIILPVVHFPYKEHYSLPRTTFFPTNDVRK